MPASRRIFPRTAQVALAMAAASVARGAPPSTAPAPANFDPIHARLQAALSLFDAGRAEAGISELDGLVRAFPSATTAAGVIAYLNGQPDAAARYLQAAAADDVAIRLLAGNADLKAGMIDAADRAFVAALAIARTPADRAYALERRTAAARQAGTLGKLADTWLASADLPPEQFLPLATALRGLGRAPALLAWWQTRAAIPAARTDRVVVEVLGAARDAGRPDDVVTVCRDLLARNPADSQSRAALTRALLDAGRADEADAALRDGLAAAKSTGDMLRLGRLDMSLGRDGPAGEAARRVEELGGATAASGWLLDAAVRRRAGNVVAVDAALAKASRVARAEPAAVDAVCNALESAGRIADAFELAHATAGPTPGESALRRLAALAMKVKRYDAATAALETLMRLPMSTAARTQAGQQLLDAAVAAGTTADLISRLKTRLDTSAGDDADLTLLVDACVRRGDRGAAVAALADSPLLDEATRLRRTAVLLFRQGDDAAADVALRRLLTADPDAAADTLELLATVAGRRHRPQDVDAAVAALRQRCGDGVAGLRTFAATLTRLGRFHDAAEAYRRVVALDPADSDGWLAWATSTARAGDPAQAMQQLQALCENAPTDDVFTAAADGLTNLGAGRSILRAVRRAGVLRFAARPDAVDLLRVLSDLSDETGDTAAAARAADMAAVLAGPQRSQMMRERMQLAVTDADVDDAVDAGRTLLALGDAFPPQAFLNLGEQLLVAGRVVGARRAFERAAAAGDPDRVRPAAADLFVRNGFPQDALDLLAPHGESVGGPADARLGALYERLGRTSDAFAANLAAITAELRANSPAESLAGDVRSAAATARTAGERRALLRSLRASLADRARDATAAGPPRSVLALRAITRDVALALGQADEADSAVSPAPPATLPATQPVTAALSPSEAARVLPGLMIDGNTDTARRVLAVVLPDRPSPAAPVQRGRPAASPFLTLVRAAAVLGDDAAASRWAAAWVQDVAAERFGEASSEILRGVWPVLTPAGRVEIVGQLRARADALPPAARDAASALLLAADAAVGDFPPDVARRAANMVAGTNVYAFVDTAGQACASLPAAMRPDYLRQASVAVPAAARLTFLAAVAARADEPMDAATLLAFTDAAAHVPPGQSFDWTDGFFGSRQPAVLIALADAILRSVDANGAATDDGDRAVSLCTAAAALANAGQADRADRTAFAAINAIFAAVSRPPTPTPRVSRPLPPDPVTMLRVAVMALSPAQRATMLTTLPADDASGVNPGDATWRRVLRAVLLDGVGDRAGALQACRDAVADDGGATPLARTYVERLQEDGRWAELAAYRPKKQAGGISVTAGQSPRVRALLNLSRWREARAAEPGGVGPDVAGLLRTHDTAGLVAALREVLQSIRNGSFDAARIYLPSPGGLPAAGTTDAELWRDALRATGVLDDLIAAAHTGGLIAEVSAGASDWLSARLVDAADEPMAGDRIVRALEDAAANSALSPTDRRTVAALAKRPDVTFPATLLDALRPAALADETGEELERYADALVARHAPSAAATRAWADAIAGTGRRAEAAAPSPADALDAAALAGRLAATLNRDPGAAGRLCATVRSAGLIRPRFLRSRLIEARIAAESGDWDVYAERLDGVLRDWGWQSISPPPGHAVLGPPPPLDVLPALPAGPDPQRRRAALGVLARSLSKAAEDWPWMSDWTRQTAAVGCWAEAHGERAIAATLFDQSISLTRRQGTGEQALWTADLADRIGRPDVAITLAQESRSARCLSIVRSFELAQRLRAAGDPAAAERILSNQD